ncbi:MAG: hypothetical protein JJU41_11165 [Bacteroidetes bacterium]|nr:hypothetical protein [Bacteroidota bacterium]
MNISRVLLACVGILLISLTLQSCTQKNESAMRNDSNWDKMDTALRSELRSKIEQESDDRVVIFVEVSENSDAYATELESMGIQVQTRTGTIWTLRGNAALLAEASSKDYIKRMELSQQRRVP